MILTFSITLTDAAGNTSEGQVSVTLGPDNDLLFSVQLPQYSYTFQVNRRALEVLSNILQEG